jgi:hypothetical protein
MGQDIGVVDDRETLSQVGYYGVRGYAWKLVIVERRQAGEDRRRIRRHREGRGIETRERRHVLDPLRPKNDIDAASDDFLGPVQRRTGRKLNEVDQYPWSCSGMKPVGVFKNSTPATPISPTYTTSAMLALRPRRRVKLSRPVFYA